MDEEVAKEQADDEFEKRREELRIKDELKREKNRKQREKAKARKEGKGGKGNGKTLSIEGMKPNPTLTPEGEQTDIENTEAKPVAAEEVGVVIHDDD